MAADRWRNRAPRGRKEPPAGTVRGFWLSLTVKSRIALVIFLAVVTACLTSAAAAPAYRATATGPSVTPVPRATMAELLSRLEAQRLFLLAVDLNRTLSEILESNAALSAEVEVLDRKAVSEGARLMASLDLLADGPEPGQDGSGDLEREAAALADAYASRYESYTFRVAAVENSMPGAGGGAGVASARVNVREACATAFEALKEAAAALDSLRSGNPAGFQAAETLLDRSSKKVEEARARLNGALVPLRSH